MCCVFVKKKNKAQLVKMYKHLTKITSYTFSKIHLLFCSIILIESYSKRKWYQIFWDTLY